MRLYILILLSLGVIQSFSMNKPFDLSSLNLLPDEQDEDDEMKFILSFDGAAAMPGDEQIFSSLSTAFKACSVTEQQPRPETANPAPYGNNTTLSTSKEKDKRKAKQELQAPKEEEEEEEEED